MGDTAQLILEQLQKSLSGVRYSASAVIAGLAFSLGGALVVLALFLILWHFCKDLYCCRMKKFSASAANPKLMDVAKTVWSSTESDCTAVIGVDAVIYLRALRMLRHIFAILTVVVCGVAIPVNVYFNLKSPFSVNLTRQDALLLMTPTLLQGTQVISHVVLGWFVNAVIFSLLWFNFAAVLKLRHGTLSHPKYTSQLVHRTVLATDIPERYRSAAGVAQLTDSVAQNSRPTGIALGHSVKQLEKLLEEHSETVHLYEKLMCTQKCADTVKEKELERRMELLENEIAEERRQCRCEATVKPFGFVSYATMSEAQDVARQGHSNGPKKANFRMAPEPRQILWTNLNLSYAARASKQATVNVIYTILLLFWIVPNAFIGCFISNLTRLAAVWPAFGRAMDAHHTLFAILQGFLAPLITTFIFMALPLLFRRFSNWQGKVTRIDREHEVLRKLYVFFFCDNYFVFSITGVIWDVIAQALSVVNSSPSPKPSFGEVWSTLRVPERIATAIVNISSFWVMYLLRAIFGVVFEMIEALQLIVRAGHALGVSRPATPRERQQANEPQPFQYAVQYLSTVFLSTIALGFTSIQPLVLPITAVYFTVALPLKKYTLLYSRITKYESNGAYWPLVNNMILFSVGFGNLMLLCIVWVQAGWQVAIPVMPLPLTVIVFKIVSWSKFDRHFLFVETDGDRFVESHEPDLRLRQATLSVGEAFENPALTCPLETPMLVDQPAGVVAKHSGSDFEYDVFDNKSVATSESDVVTGIHQEKPVQYFYGNERLL